MTIYTQAYLDTLDRAIASGALEVEYQSGDESRKTKFRSMSDLMRARDHVCAEIAAAAGQPSRSMITYAEFHRD